MNLENINSISAVLTQAGLDQLSYPLLLHICCRPVQFTLRCEQQIGSDRLECSVFIERSGSNYCLRYYDASLIKVVDMPDLTINQVSLTELQADMEAINWKQDASSVIPRLDDPSTYAREMAIDRIVGDLNKLSASVEGKPYADALKLRFWTNTVIEQLLGSLGAVKSRLQVSQRFYFGHTEVISVQEAYRFLQNRWMEKALSAKRRTDAGGSRADDPGPGAGDHPGKLIKKRKVHKNRKLL